METDNTVLLEQQKYKIKDRRHTDFTKYRSTLDRLKNYSEKLEAYYNQIDDIILKKG